MFTKFLSIVNLAFQQPIKYVPARTYIYTSLVPVCKNANNFLNVES